MAWASSRGRAGRPPRPRRAGRDDPRICPRLCFRLDNFSGVVYARDSLGLLFAFIDQHVIPELLSMNLLMSGMVPTVMGLRTLIASGADSLTPAFWFVMSIGLLVGVVIAHPMNWWLVTNHLRHGMMTVRPAGMLRTMQDHDANAGASRAAHCASSSGGSQVDAATSSASHSGAIVRRPGGCLGDRLLVWAMVNGVGES